MQPSGLCLFLISAAGLCAAPLTMARNGRPSAEIVVADDAGSVAREAAADLQAYLKRITGAKLPLRRESAASTMPARMFVGQTRAALAAGLDPAKLPSEGYAIRRLGNELFIIGADRTARDRGTFFGTTSFLETDLGVRWLWPGELGTEIPARPTLTVESIDRTGTPFMHIRTFRDAVDLERKITRGMEQLGMDKGRHGTMIRESREWLRHTGAGGDVRADYGHAFTHWWNDYHVQHPGFFAMMPDGSRAWPWPNYDRVKICVSNPAVAQQWMSNAREYFRTHADSISFSASPNDNVLQGHCTCAQCEAWDDPRGEKYPMVWHVNGRDISKEHVSLTDRYVHFYNLVADMLAKEFPDKVVGAYAYGSWKNPPMHEREIRRNIMLGYVGTVTIYTSERSRQDDLARWGEWSRLVSKLFFRPNLFWEGDGMPLVYVHKLAADMRHRADHGMMGADFDSLVHHWSTEGLNYYVLAKLLWDPHLDVDRLIDDYTRAAFGPAAPEMKAYFAAVEQHTDEIESENPPRIEEDGPKGFIRMIPRLYPEPVLDGWAKRLEGALAKTPAGSVYARRIQWMILGVEFARLHTRLVTLTTKENPTAADRDAIIELSARHDAWYRAHLYDWSIYPPLLRWVEPARLFGGKG